MAELTLRDLWRARNFSPNPNQEQAILHTDGPLYLPAGPGSGKTRVLLWRTVNLIVFHDVNLILLLQVPRMQIKIKGLCQNEHI